jgi:hypothetical protein
MHLAHVPLISRAWLARAIFASRALLVLARNLSI